VNRSISAVLVGTFTLRFSTGLTGALLIYYLADLPKHGGQAADPITLSFLTAAFFISELCLSPLFGLLSDRLGHHRVMQFGPVFGFIAVILTGLTTNLWVLGSTRFLEGASTAASVPSILGFLAMATAGDEALRGRTSARFEAATIAGLGAGLAAAGPLWAIFGPIAFFLNAGVYLLSLLIYRYRVAAPDSPAGPGHRPGYGINRYAQLLTKSHVWLLAPTWIALNGALGLYTSQTLFQLIREKDPRFSNQLLVGGFSPLLVTAGLIVAGIIFFAGLVWWGNRFKLYRRTTIIFMGIVGGAILVFSALLLNHSEGLSDLLKIPPAIGLAIGLFILAGATPAALGMLADISESFPDDRGAIMGLYSVFLAVGQIVGGFVGGLAAQLWALDGILVATFAMMGIAVVPLARLRRFEFRFATSPDVSPSLELMEPGP
jgi:MFS family permease